MLRGKVLLCLRINKIKIAQLSLALSKLKLQSVIKFNQRMKGRKSIFIYVEKEILILY